jgi:hypothetical protein
MDVTFLTSRVLFQDGIEYTLSVYRSAVGCFGFWECEACENQGRPTSPVSDSDAAIDACTMLIDQHHARYHQKVAHHI